MTAWRRQMRRTPRWGGGRKEGRRWRKGKAAAITEDVAAHAAAMVPHRGISQRGQASRGFNLAEGERAQEEAATVRRKGDNGGRARPR
nr:unnamed protein product [Digitaria exilis]